MNFDFSEDQVAIRELAYQICTDAASDENMLTFSRSGETYDNSLWQTLAEQGLLAISIPEEFGGSGLGFVELCLVMEELGRRVAPVPVFSSLVLGGLPLAEFGTQSARQRWLQGLASGEVQLTAALAEVGMNAALATEVTAQRTEGGWVLNGEKSVVTDGAVADAIGGRLVKDQSWRWPTEVQREQEPGQFTARRHLHHRAWPCARIGLNMKLNRVTALCSDAIG